VADEVGDLAAFQTRLDVLRSGLGTQLANVRTAAAISRPQLGLALDRTRSFISKVEHGIRRMPTELWKIADELCSAEGVLLAAHAELVRAEQDYRARCRRSRLPLQPTPDAPDAWPLICQDRVGCAPA
jgi:transcriptional regulator with XRE-family HTH domain